MGRVYDEFEQLSMGGDGKAPLPFAEAVYQANINDRLANMPGLKEHFKNTKHLASFSSGNEEDARRYNLLSGFDYAKMTDRGFFESLPDGLAYAIIDSMKNKDQDFFDMEGGIGDFIRNMKGVAIQTDTNPFGKFFSKEEAEKLIKEYNDKMKTKKARGGIISLIK
tara:strand:+ start:44 stop:541 length:498 start_codon:yes stop_codon:yes gene_type:complete